MKQDIRVDFGFRGHRKRKRLARALGISMGPADYLINLWIRAACDRCDGILEGWENEDIADAAEWDGDPDKFVDALVDGGWIELIPDSNNYKIHDWEIHQPWIYHSRERSEKASAAARARWFGAPYNANSNARSIAKRNAPSPIPSPSPSVVSEQSEAQCSEHCSEHNEPEHTQGKRVRATQIPDSFNFKIASEIAEKHFSNSVDARSEFDQFIDYHKARASTFKDWKAAWRTWCRNSIKFKAKTTTVPGKSVDGGGSYTPPNRTAELMSQARRRELYLETGDERYR